MERAMHPFWTLVLLVCFAACGGGSGDSSSQLDSYETPGLPGQVDEKPLPDADFAELDVQTMLAPALRFRARLLPGYPGVYEYVLTNTGSGYVERFLIQPATGFAGPRPLLVVFHKYSASHADLLNTGFLAESAARGWHVMCPLGARGKHYGNLESQINTQAAIELATTQFAVDTSRVYGVGFSMGGGAGANYAARHVNPERIMFAAFVNHTGTVSLQNEWTRAVDDTDADDNQPFPGNNLEGPDLLESYFGGTPAARPFQYARCSTIETDSTTSFVLPSYDFARNLAHIPTLTWRITNEPVETQYLAQQTQLFHGVVAARSPAAVEQVVPGTEHRWGTLNPAQACAFLAQHTLQVPTAGDLLADEDGRWFRFLVTQETFQANGAFTRVRWTADAATRTIEVLDTDYLKRMQTSSSMIGFGLTGGVPFKVRMSAADGLPDEVLLTSLGQSAPSVVLRDGVPTTAYVWDAQAGSLLLAETDAALHEWTITIP
jgi:poly(3-hydroxybutyrate) depolymerase